MAGLAQRILRQSDIAVASLASLLGGEIGDDLFVRLLHDRVGIRLVAALTSPDRVGSHARHGRDVVPPVAVRTAGQIGVILCHQVTGIVGFDRRGSFRNSAISASNSDTDWAGAVAIALAWQSMQ